MQIPPNRILMMCKLRIEHSMNEIGDNATPLNAAKFAEKQISERFFILYKNTRNPIYIWRFLAVANRFCIISSYIYPELRGLQLADRIPDWCVEYFIASAYRVEALARGRDHRKPDNEGLSVSIVHPDEIEIPPKNAADLIPNALEFTRDGWNSFKEFQMDEFIDFFLGYNEVMEYTPSDKIKFSEIMDYMGWTDERNARRKISEVKGRRAKPSPKV